MDRKGFDIVDKAYQSDLHNQTQKITEKWNAFYSKKQYVGDKEMQAKAKAADEAQKKQRISADIGAAKKTLSYSHYPDKGREAALKEVERQELLKKRSEEMRKKFQEKSMDKKKGRGR